MKSTPQHLDEKQARLIKKKKCFSCKEREHTVYNSSRKKKIIAISEDFIKNNSS